MKKSIYLALGLTLFLGSCLSGNEQAIGDRSEPQEVVAADPGNTDSDDEPYLSYDANGKAIYHQLYQVDEPDGMKVEWPFEDVDEDLVEMPRLINYKLGELMIMVNVFDLDGEDIETHFTNYSSEYIEMYEELGEVETTSANRIVDGYLPGFEQSMTLIYEEEGTYVQMISVKGEEHYYDITALVELESASDNVAIIDAFVRSLREVN